jgi:hypothetical protein
MRRVDRSYRFVASPVVLRLQQTLTETQLSDDARQQMQLQIQHEILSLSEHMESHSFRAFHPLDLERMVRAYDQRFLGGACYAALNGRPLSFRLAPRLTRAGGKTTWRMLQEGRTGQRYEEFEISVSSHLLFQTFRDEQRQIKVVGLPCSNRLEAMQRIVEHELIHLCEKLAWDDSSCKARRFQEIAHRLFGHREHTHQLVTTAELARTRHGIRTGTKVTFLIDGQRLTGVVNKLTKRATVLVLDPHGRRYSDGRTYTRYYVPLGMLAALE